MSGSKETNGEQDILLGLFKAYLEDLGRIGARHETLRQFYITVISALFVFLAMAGKEGLFRGVRGGVVVLVAAVGITVCVAWSLHMWSFSTLYLAKKATLSQLELEAKFPFKPFTTEAIELAKRYRLRLTDVDRIVAVAFILLFLALLFFKVGNEAPSAAN